VSRAEGTARGVALEDPRRHPRARLD
jgi:hypothetical protein